MLLSLVTLLLGIVARSYVGFEALVPRVVALLARLMKKDVTPDYHYYGIPSPWLQASSFLYCLPSASLVYFSANIGSFLGPGSYHLYP